MKRSLETTRLIPVCVALLVFIVFLPTLRNDFIVHWDDNKYICENSFIRSLDINLIKSAFLSVQVSNWHPLTWISHAVDYSIWGLNPVGHHLTSILLHSVNTLLVILLLRRLLDAANLSSAKHRENQDSVSNEKERQGSDNGALIAASTAGLLFGLHPLHVESVVWVSERKDLLCGLFFLASIIMFSRYVNNTVVSLAGNKRTRPHSRTKSYLISLALFLLALLSKPMAITLPLVLLILDWYPFKRVPSSKTIWPVFIEKLPFFIPSVLFSIATVLAQKTGGATKVMEFVPISTRLLVAVKSLNAYLSKMIWPFHLSPFYSYPRRVSLDSREYFCAMILLAGITAACLLIAKKRGFWLAGWSYYVITLLPVLGLVQVGMQSMADRYTYLPSLGPFLIVGVIAAGSYKRLSAIRQCRAIVTVGSLLLSIGVLAGLSYATVNQIVVWNNSASFWNYVIENGASEVAFPHNNLGGAYASLGRFDEAIAEYQTALRLAPGYGEAHNNLGLAYAYKGNLDTAIAEYRAALRLDPDYAEAHNNLGLAYAFRDQLDMAITEYQIALRLEPRYAPAHNNLGLAYASKGLLDLATKEYQEAVDLKPDAAESHFNLGVVYLRSGRLDLARREAEASLNIKPGFHEARRLFDKIISRQY